MAKLTPDQLALLQADLDAAKAADRADDNAQATVIADQDDVDNATAQLADDTQAQVATAAAVDAADQKLLADVESMVNPPTA